MADPSNPQPRPSSTAIGAAVMRAAHALLDDHPKVFDDPLALALSGVPGEPAVRGAVERLHREFAAHADAEFARELARHLRASIALRNRYAEDELEAAMARGVDQYVLLGAGLDSFALRRADLAARLDIYELDLPATQAWKRQRLRELNAELPARLRFVPADFERQTPMQALAAAGFRRDRPAFFSWLGVTSYLGEDAVYATLRDLASAAPGSEVVFSYGLREDLIAAGGRRIHDALKASVAARNEPAANSGFDPAALAARLRALGYGRVEDFTVAMADARYFASRRDGLRAPPMTHLMKARVG